MSSLAELHFLQYDCICIYFEAFSLPFIFGAHMKNSRRQFMILSAAGACTLALNGKVQAQAMVSPTDPQAAALGYVPDASKVDKAKYAKYAAGQQCSSCALFQGKADAAAGGCSLYAGKQVASKGWCSAYAKKA